LNTSSSLVVVGVVQGVVLVGVAQVVIVPITLLLLQRQLLNYRVAADL